MNVHFQAKRVTSILIIGVALVIVLWGEVRLNNVRDERAALLEEAHSLGIPMDALGIDSKMLPTKSHHRLARENIRRQGGDVIQLILGIQKAGYEGSGNDLETQRMKNILDASLLDLSVAQVETLIKLLRDADEIDFDECENLAAFALGRLADRDPVGFIELVLHSDLRMPGNIPSKAFSLWAARDLEAAVSWIEEHEDARPDLVHEDTKREVISSAARQDPELAFRLISRLSFELDWLAAQNITDQAKRPEMRDAALRGLREYLATVEDESAKAKVARSGYTRLGYAMRRQGFDTITDWLATAGLDEHEFENILKGFGNSETRTNQGMWLDWVAVNLPPNLRDKRVDAIMAGWLEQDSHAAGTWLAQAPESPAKHVAVHAYARKVVPFEPKIAEQWALTLPPGAARTELLKELHRNWPENQKSEKDAFAARHGIR